MTIVIRSNSLLATLLRYCAQPHCAAIYVSLFFFIRTVLKKDGLDSKIKLSELDKCAALKETINNAIKKVMTITKNASIFLDNSKVKNLGIWMDHSNAHLTEFITDPITTEIISNRPNRREKEHAQGISEDSRHLVEQRQQAEYYQKLSDIILNFQDVLLFGPTGAKLELLNLLRSDQQFKDIKLDIKESDKMSQNKQHAFVREHFSHH